MMKIPFRFFLVLCLQSGFFLRAQDIFTAVRKGDMKRLEELVKINPDTVNSLNESGFSPLIIAAYRNQPKAVEFLLSHRAQVNADSPEGPAILGTCYKGNMELTELLIAHGADVNVQNSQGTSGLIYACLANNAALVELLLKHGAKKDLAEKSGRTALSIARANNSETILALLENKK